MPTERLETTPCPICEANRPGRTPFGQGAYLVVRCGDCGLLYLSPRLKRESMMERYRDAAYFEGSASGYASYSEQEGSLRRTFQRLLKLLRSQGLTGGAVLDVGCGPGIFLEEARPYFTNRMGTELSRETATVARGKADAVWAGGIESVPEGSRFDLVVALHVVEHVYDPVQFLSSLASRARPGGNVLLATPDAGSWWLRLMGKRWPSFKFPEHITFFDFSSLTRLFLKAGISDLSRIQYTHAFPASEVLRKLGLPAPSVATRHTIWIPGTTLAIAGKVGT